MVTKAEKLGLAFVFALVFISALTMNSKQPVEVETQTDIEVRAFVGIPAENKLGGIEFEVLDRYGYHRVIFSVRGFNKGLKLNDVICFSDGKDYCFNQRDSWNWNTWLERFQEVLTEATTGEKSNTPNTPSSE